MTVGVGLVSGQMGEQVSDRNADHNGGNDGDPHGGDGIASTAHNTAEDLCYGNADVTHCHDLHHGDSQIDQLGSVCKQVEQEVTEEQQNDGNAGGESRGDETTLLHALEDPVVFACAHVLSGVDRHCLTKGEVGHHGKAVHTHDDNIAGNDSFAHCVCQIQNHHTGSGHDRLCNAGGDSNTKDPAGYRGDQLHGPEAEVKQIAHSNQLDIAEDSGNTLRDNGC